jgi:ribosomal silencing factor RsfS
MSHENHPQARAIAVPVKPTLEDKMLKFIEGHNPQIWAVIALLAVVVVLAR